jgi:myo-inositol-hexaphosphate 3-phosphohydrolase
MIRVFSLPDMKEIDNGGIEVFVGESQRDPMGISLYKNSDNVYAIVGRKSGPDGTFLWQYKLYTDENGFVNGKKVRAFGRFSGKKEIESIVVDDDLGFVYYSDETVGVRQFFASADSSGRELSMFATKGVKNDHEGLSIFPTSEKTGYILLSDQQANRFQIFSREGTGDEPFNHKLIKVVKVAARDSDGSDVTAVSLNNTFKHGLFVAMSTDKTFHFYRWEDIAGKTLLVDKKIVSK